MEQALVLLDYESNYHEKGKRVFFFALFFYFYKKMIEFKALFGKYFWENFLF